MYYTEPKGLFYITEFPLPDIASHAHVVTMNSHFF